MNDLTAVAVVVLCVALTAYFAACETVLTRVGVVRALRLNEEEERGAEHLLWLAEHPARGLNVILLLTVATRVTAATVLAIVALRASSWVVAAAAAGLVLASFVFAEVAPRTYTLRRLDRVSLALAPSISRLARLLRPVAALLVQAGGRIGGRHGAGPFASDEELRRLMEPVAEDQEDEIEIEDEERAMIHSVLELGDTVCREIMVPRPDVVSVSVDTSLPQVVDTVVRSGYSRIPVWEGTRDDIVGIIYAKDVLHLIGVENGDRWQDRIREATFVPESKRADDLLRDLQRQKVHLAIVVDEHGAVTGLVTIEDILEEIVGEIVDEHDHEEPPVVWLDDRRLRLSARVTVHDVNELLDGDLPEEEGWDTVGGLLIGLLGRVPDPGDAVSVENVTLVAEQVRGRRVEKVLLTVADVDAEVVK